MKKKSKSPIQGIFPVLLCLSVGLAITASQCFGQSQKPAVQAPYAYLFPAHL
ncbi:MAG: hypothetical protein HQ515_10065, partial [Phycisphaeraceae bacterium]|nr:hypothetical protein [Phycisphaeraceae bacterium]